MNQGPTTQAMVETTYTTVSESKRDIDTQAGFKMLQPPVMHSSYGQQRAMPYQTN